MRRASVVLAAFALASPLVAVPGTGWDVARLPVVLAFAAGLLALQFFRSSRGGERPPEPAPLRTAGLILIAAHLISLVSARSLTDAVEPILILAAGVTVYGCMRGGLLRREPALALIPVISGVALIVACIGIGQKLAKVEAVATEGNRNYAGALCAMLLPPAVAFSRAGRPWTRALAGLAAAGLVAELLISESRGGFLGALTGLLLAGGVLVIRKVPRGAAVASAAIAVLVVTFSATQGQAQMSQTRLETAVFRLEAWKSGLRMFGRRPLIGWGAGGFSTEYPPFRSEAEFHISHSDGRKAFIEVEDPHSSWVAVGVETGALGLLALLLVVYVAARLWRYYVRKSPDPETSALLAGLGGGAAAYLVAGGFNTLTLHVSHTVLFWGFLALIEILGDQRPWRAGSRVREARAAIPAAAAVVAAFACFWTLRTAEAEAAIREGMQEKTTDKVRESLLREAIDLDPNSWKAHYYLAQVLSEPNRYATAASEARTAVSLRPHHVEARNLAAIAIMRSKGDGAEAERHLRHAIEVAPFYFKSYYNLALVERERGHSGELRELLTKSIGCKPDHGASYYYRGLALLVQGEGAPALEDFRMARGLRIDVGAALRADRPSAASDPRLAEFFK
jgi:O-antigen ligase/Tfp pilus assembly protein PilF